MEGSGTRGIGGEGAEGGKCWRVGREGLAAMRGKGMGVVVFTVKVRSFTLRMGYGWEFKGRLRI